MIRRFGVAVCDWPVAWRVLWEAALAPSESLFDAAAATLRADTINIRAEAIGLFVGFLQRSVSDGTVPLPQHCLTPDHIQKFVDEQRARGVRNSTIVFRLSALSEGLRMMLPGLNVSLLHRPGGRPLRQALPRHSRHIAISDHREILAKVLELHAEGMTGKSYANGHVALRDAALMGLLFATGTRRRALIAMEIGRNLYRRGGQYWVRFEACDTKTGHAYDMPLPAMLTPVFDAYLTIARPALGGAKTTKLWISTRGNPMGAPSIVSVSRSRTREWTGIAHGPHWARKCITTTVRFVAPELARDVAIVLDHSLAVADQHYDLGTGIAAAMRHEQRMAKRQKATASRADAAFRRSMSEVDFLKFRRSKPGCW